MLTILLVSPAPDPRERVLRFGKMRRLVLLNLTQALSECLVETSRHDRPRVVQGFDLGDEHVYLLDHIEILFDPPLQIHPLRWLEQRAKDRDLFVAWPGEFDEQHLSYAEPGHPEHQRFEVGSYPAIKTECI